jgi:hypothetical protein
MALVVALILMAHRDQMVRSAFMAVVVEVMEIVRLREPTVVTAQ